MASALKPDSSWQSFMAGSPRALTPPTLRRPRHCSKSWLDVRIADSSSGLQHLSAEPAHCSGYLERLARFIRGGVIAWIAHLNSIGRQALQRVLIHRDKDTVLQAQVAQGG